MPGAWELRQKPTVLIGIPHTWTVSMDFAYSLMRLDKSGLGIIPFHFEHDVPLEYGRNMIASEALARGAEYLLFMDSDSIVPAYGLKRLLGHKLPIVGGLYWRRHPNIFPIVHKWIDPPGRFEPYPADEVKTWVGLQPVDATGCGFLLIHRRVLEALAPHVPEKAVPLKSGEPIKFREFFKFTIDQPPYLSEDLYFFWLVKKHLKIQPYVDAMVKMMHIAQNVAIEDGEFAWTPLETYRP